MKSTPVVHQKSHEHFQIINVMVEHAILIIHICVVCVIEESHALPNANYISFEWRKDRADFGKRCEYACWACGSETSHVRVESPNLGGYQMIAPHQFMNKRKDETSQSCVPNSLTHGTPNEKCMSAWICVVDMQFLGFARVLYQEPNLYKLWYILRAFYPHLDTLPLQETNMCL